MDQAGAGDWDAYLRLAIACFGEALRYFSKDATPWEFVQAQMYMGQAYLQLPEGDKDKQLAQAIHCFEEALRIPSPPMPPIERAFILRQRGATLLQMPAHDVADHLKHVQHATACFRDALSMYVADKHSPDYGLTCKGLGDALTAMPIGIPALQVIGTTLPEVEGAPWGRNVQEAISYYREALKVLTVERTPFEHALTLASLGNAYGRSPVEDRYHSLRHAVTCYRNALHVFTPGQYPYEYASVQTNMGNCFAALATNQPAGNREQAVACYHEALRIHTFDGAPRAFRGLQRNLGRLYSLASEWQAADGAYTAAIAAGEHLFRIRLSEESKRIEAQENALLYREAAFVAAQLGDVNRAMLTLEHGKAQLLVEALRLRIARPAGVPDMVWAEFERARAAVQGIQPGEPGGSGQDEYARHEARARRANHLLHTALEAVRQHAPAFLQAINLPGLRLLLPDASSALLAFCLTAFGGIGFLVLNDPDSTGVAVRSVDLPAATADTVGRLAFGQPDAQGRLAGGWLEGYLRYFQQGTPDALANWQRDFDHFLARVGADLIGPILAVLPPSIDRLILLPSGVLNLLPLHAAPLLQDPSLRVCDRYQVTYAPAAEVLAATRSMSTSLPIAEILGVNGDRACAVINPEADSHLGSASLECQAILDAFPEARIIRGKAGTRKAVLEAARGKALIHFLCHGRYDWQDPSNSRLQLADGPLTLADLQHGLLGLPNTRLAVLSACESGLADVFGSTDEYVGIPAGFLLAGAQCVVTSLWAVPDLPTALLMREFYRRLAHGEAIPAALQAAQLWLRDATAEELELADLWWQRYESGGNSNIDAFMAMRLYRANPKIKPFQHPYYWAAFVCNGL